MSDVLGDATGHLSAPKRYNTGDRETIDKMRDLSFGAARRFLGPIAAECSYWSYIRDKDNWGCPSCIHPGSSMDYRDVVNRVGLQCQAAQQGTQ